LSTQSRASKTTKKESDTIKAQGESNLKEMATVKGKTLFVTVGTTKFDNLVDTVCQVAFLDLLWEQGFAVLRIQFGPLGAPPDFSNESASKLTFEKTKDEGPVKIGRVRWPMQTPKPSQRLLRVEWFPIKASISADLCDSAVVIGHAGAGTIIETLRARAGARLVVITNPSLMDNHQEELAHAMHSEGYLMQTTCKDLLAAFKDFDRVKLKAYPRADAFAFSRLLDKELGF